MRMSFVIPRSVSELRGLRLHKSARAAAAKAGWPENHRPKGQGQSIKDGIYHDEFDLPEPIPATAFINAEIHYYNPSHLFQSAYASARLVPPQ